jgi:hypothetical protein
VILFLLEILLTGTVSKLNDIHAAQYQPDLVHVSSVSDPHPFHADPDPDPS